MNVRLYSGTVRCADHFDASSYESETTDPCLYCGAVPVPVTQSDEEWINTLSAMVVDTPKRFVQFVKVPCDWCWEPANWKIVDDCALNGYQNACTDHGEEWYPDLFPTAEPVQYFQVNANGERELVTDGS